MRPSLVDRQHLARLLRSSDYLRRSPARLGGRGGYKEWQHFLVHAGDTHLLVNLSFLDEEQPGRSEGAEVARLIVLAHDDGGWDGDVDLFGEEELQVSAGQLDARLGRNELLFEDGTYRLSIALRERPVAVELELVPTTLPAFSANHPLTPERHISWLFVPRLVARGTLTLAGRTLRLEDAPAYHDHNWGHFGWGDDFCWEWGSVLPREPANPWSAVLVRMMDRARSVVRYQALFVWYGGEPVRVFRDEELSLSTPCCFQPARPFTLPRPLALLVPGTAADLPRSLEVHAQGGGDSVQLTFTPRHAARIVVPVEVSPEKVTIIHEVLGSLSLRGHVRGERVELEGTGVFEFVRD
jgi:hypothetical protein